jgi:hypothetical protein
VANQQNEVLLELVRRYGVDIRLTAGRCCARRLGLARANAQLESAEIMKEVDGFERECVAWVCHDLVARISPLMRYLLGGGGQGAGQVLYVACQGTAAAPKLKFPGCCDH